MKVAQANKSYGNGILLNLLLICKKMSDGSESEDEQMEINGSGHDNIEKLGLVKTA